jgi:multiple sugar transport system substrate-binding protein
MLRRVFYVMAVLALVAASAWANGAKEGGGAASGQALKLQANGMPEYTGPEVSLTFWSWVPAIDKAVAEFEKAYPNIKITWDNVGNGTTEYNKLITALQAGSGAPDVAQLEYQALPTFINQGGVVDLAKYGAGEVKDQFVPWTWSQVSRGNSVYAIPQDTGPLAFAYRKDIYDK